MRAIPKKPREDAVSRRTPKKTSPAVIERDALGPVRRYFHESRDLFTSLILVLPLFILYQIGVLATDGVRNGVDFVTDLMWMAAQNQLGIYVAINLGVLVVFALSIFFMRHRGTFRPQLWPLIVAESTVYGVLFGGVVIGTMSALGLGALLSSGGSGQTFVQAVVLSLGAGLYEEIVFRLIGTGGLFWALQKLGKAPPWANAAIAVIVSSLIFSAIHHIGALGDPFTMGVFLFRFFAGALLALIFTVRGFAVAVYTHAIYDLIVMIGRL